MRLPVSDVVEGSLFVGNWESSPLRRFFHSENLWLCQTKGRHYAREEQGVPGSQWASLLSYQHHFHCFT